MDSFAVKCERVQIGRQMDEESVKEEYDNRQPNAICCCGRDDGSTKSNASTICVYDESYVVWPNETIKNL